MFYAFLLASLAGCAPVVLQVKGGQIQTLSSVRPNEVVLVGSVELMPAIKGSERNFSKIQNKGFVDAHNKIFWLVKGKKWLKISDFDIYEGAGGMSTDFTNHTPVPINGAQFAVTSDSVSTLYISGGYFPATTRKVTHVTKYLGSSDPMNNSTYMNTQSEYTMVAKYMDFKLKVHMVENAKAIYIGDIKIYRDNKFNVKKVVIKDNYKQANINFKQQFKTNENLARSLARK